MLSLLSTPKRRTVLFLYPMGFLLPFLLHSIVLAQHHGDHSPNGPLLRWSEPATWQGEGFRVATCDDEACLCDPVVPTEGKSVTIPAHARVLLDVDTPVLNGVMIHGELLFEDTAEVGLSAHWIMVMGEGSILRIGSEEIPYENETHITLFGTDIAGNISGDGRLSGKYSKISPRQWTEVIFDDPGSIGRHARILTGTVYLQAGKVYHWYHAAANTFAAAPEPHTLLWRKPSMSEFEPFNITYLRPAPGPLAEYEPAVSSVLNDAIPDWWKLANGIDSLSDDPQHRDTGSLANDGLTNLQKFLFGLPPRTPSAAPKALVEISPTESQIRFPAQPGRRYQLQHSTDLVNWYSLGELQTVPSGRDLTWKIEPQSHSRSFFRVAVSPDPPPSPPRDRVVRSVIRETTDRKQKNRFSAERGSDEDRGCQ